MIYPLPTLHCPCGGIFVGARTTPEEENKFGCGRPGCCAWAVVCNKCGQRITGESASPDVDLDF